MQLRVDYLEVLMRLLENSPYRETLHKRSELVSCLRSLADEENPDQDRSTDLTKRLASDALTMI
jgi:hypothetical protein